MYLTAARSWLVVLVIAALALTMGVAVSWHLTTAVSAWEQENVAAIVRGEVIDADTSALLGDTSPATRADRWHGLLSQIASRIPGVVRCKVWSRDGVVLWSDSAALIGTRAADDHDLRAAIGGRVTFRLMEPDREDTEAAWQSQVLSRIYVPVAEPKGGPVRAVIELRKIPMRLSAKLTAALVLVWSIAAAGAVAMWLVVRPFGRARREATPATSRPARAIVAEIRARFGFVPPFFEPAFETAPVLDNLWRQTMSAYIDNPLPALFKEKLFAYLSRYCAAPYCIVCHSCALRPLGMTAAEVIQLLEGPRREPDITAALTLLAAEPRPIAEWPTAGSALDTALFDAAVFLFVHPDRSERCQHELRRLLGTLYAHLVEFLGYVRSCHAWIEAHRELSYEADQRVQANLGPLVAAEPRLAEFFRTYRDRVLREREGAEALRLADLEARAAELRQGGRARQG
jgi:hypothetical protein